MEDILSRAKSFGIKFKKQAQQFSAGEWYINVHTQDHQPGEIRGQVMPPKS